jgi:beta-glucosidase-like glycosyl hydrolase
MYPQIYVKTTFLRSELESIEFLVFNGVPSSCFPSSTGLGSTFDVELALKIGKALGDESRAKGSISFPYLLHILPVINLFNYLGCHVLLAPTVNTQRSPLGGRGFESFSEDPSPERHDRCSLYQRRAV